MPAISAVTIHYQLAIGTFLVVGGRLGGVPGIMCIPEGAVPGRALLHFHFGGSVGASMHSDRKAAGPIAKAPGARSLVVGFRLAPPHPLPAHLHAAANP